MYEMDPFVHKVLERGMATSAARFYQSNAVRGAMYTKLGPLFEKYQILCAPTLAVPAVKAEQSNADPDFRINGKKVYAYLGWQMTYAFNLVPQFPAISVPSGFASTGVPTGLHMVARTFDDMAVFQAAAAFEKAAPWRGKRPQL
jgi:Asp-tRNA(Asn)/Glu-tRNA(Gln) amidotransferase A subunit family amidase